MSPTTSAGDFIPTCAGVGGGWRRNAHINISAGDDCPSGWHKDTYAYSGVSFCRVVSDSSGGCSSAYFSTNGTSYQRVCGRARGYQKGETDAFYAYRHSGQTTILLTLFSPTKANDKIQQHSGVTGFHVLMYHLVIHLHK